MALPDGPRSLPSGSAALIVLDGGAELEVPDLVLHAFTDGRDTLPESGAGYLATVAWWMQDAGVGRIGTVVGRYYAMDRDRRWDRVQLAYDLLVHGRASNRADSGEAAARDAYERGETDEFTRRRSGSSTSPTPTWSDTRG